MSHRRRSLVNFAGRGEGKGGQDIFARKYMHEKFTKCPNFMTFAGEKITANARILHDICPKKITQCPNFT